MPLVARRAPEREGPVLRHRQRDPRRRWSVRAEPASRSAVEPSPHCGRERVADAARAGAAGVRATTRPRRSARRARVRAPRTARASASMRAGTSRGCSSRRSTGMSKREILNNDLRTRGEVLPGEPARREGGRDRARVVRGEGAAADSRQRVRDSHARSGAVGVPHAPTTSATVRSRS